MKPHTRWKQHFFQCRSRFLGPFSPTLNNTKLPNSHTHHGFGISFVWPLAQFSGDMGEGLNLLSAFTLDWNKFALESLVVLGVSWCSSTIENQLIFAISIPGSSISSHCLLALDLTRPLHTHFRRAPEKKRAR
jgi:hypothetical protein